MKIKDKILSETSEEVKQRVRDIANKLVIKQEIFEEYDFLVITKEVMDKFAIEFAEWLIEKEREHPNRIIRMNKLLEIYKKTL